MRESNCHEEPIDIEYINRRIALYNQRFSADVSPSERVYIIISKKKMIIKYLILIFKIDTR